MPASGSIVGLVGTREREHRRATGTAGLVAAVLVAAAGLAGWTVPAWIIGALALAGLGIRGLTAARTA